jgi:choice-of-anchor B domain-containing protein
MKLRCLGTVLLAAASTAQVSRNVELLSVWKSPSNPPGAEYSDVWGYHDPDTHREIAIIGSTEGVHILDCTDPRNVRELISYVTPVPGNNNAWRDMKTFGHHLYEVSEAFGGTRIIGLKAAVPTLKAWWGQGFWSHAHNIGMDRGTGIAYACGTDQGVVMFDCVQDPANPTRIGTFTTPYIHDLAVADGYAYFCAQNSNQLRIYDATGVPALVELGRATLPGTQVAHNCWPSRDGRVCVTTNEAAAGPVGIFDISDKRNPRLLATYRGNPQGAPNAIPHNAYIRDGVAHISHYTEGYRAVDISDPSNPAEVGFYDTYAGASGGYDGAWGCYDEQPSGVIYVSDISSGLFVLKPNATTVLHGAATLGSGGVAPTLHTSGAAWKGNANWGFEVDRARPSSAGVLFLASARQSVVLQGLAINVDLGPGAIAIGLASDANGRARRPLPLAATLANGTVQAQAFFQDAGSVSPLGLSATTGMEIEIFVR